MLMPRRHTYPCRALKISPLRSCDILAGTQGLNLFKLLSIGFETSGREDSLEVAFITKELGLMKAARHTRAKSNNFSSTYWRAKPRSQSCVGTNNLSRALAVVRSQEGCCSREGTKSFRCVGTNISCVRLLYTASGVVAVTDNFGLS